MAARLLIVEDDPMCSAVFARFLEEEGYEVKAVATQHEAVQIGVAFRPDLLIADWLLKDDDTGLDGIDVAESLHAEIPQMPIIFMTGLPRVILQRQVRGLPVHKVFEKPVEPQDLLNCVRQALGHKECRTASA